MSGGGRTYARQQLNMPFYRLASWVFSEKEFLKSFEENGYELIFRIPHNQNTTHKNAPGPSHSVSMVLKRQQ